MSKSTRLFIRLSAATFCAALSADRQLPTAYCLLL